MIGEVVKESPRNYLACIIKKTLAQSKNASSPSPGGRTALWAWGGQGGMGWDPLPKYMCIGALEGNPALHMTCFWLISHTITPWVSIVLYYFLWLAVVSSIVLDWDLSPHCPLELEAPKIGSKTFRMQSGCPLPFPNQLWPLSCVHEP